MTEGTPSRPRAGAKVHVSIRITRQQSTVINRLAVRHGVKRSTAFRYLLERGLDFALDSRNDLSGLKR